MQLPAQVGSWTLMDEGFFNAKAGFIVIINSGYTHSGKHRISTG